MGKIDKRICEPRGCPTPGACSATKLIAALQQIRDLTPGGPHISAKDGMSAALASLDRARDIARNALRAAAKGA